MPLAVSLLTSIIRSRLQAVARAALSPRRVHA
jgi:hypothetical protein